MTRNTNMEQNHKAYPAIAKATLEMAYDNGGINRDRSEENCMQDLDAVLGAEGVYHDDLVKIDAWFASLSDDQMQVAVAGEETEMKVLLASAPPHTDELLNDIFDNAS